MGFTREFSTLTSRVPTLWIPLEGRPPPRRLRSRRAGYLGLMADLFAELRQDHLGIVDLLSQLRGDPASAGPSSEQRAQLAERLVIVASRHEALEEQFFWPTF